MGLFDKLKGKKKEKTKKVSKDNSKEWRDSQKFETGELSEDELDTVTGGPNQEYLDAVNGRIIDSGNPR